VIVDYGDGQTDNLGGITATTTISHTYARPGTYRVTATVTDIQGLTNNASLVINVSERSPITVTLNASPNPVTLGGLQQGLVQFTANATTSGTGTTGLTYFWDFGDGASAITSGGTTNHRYSATGTYVTRLTVRSATGQEGFGEVTVRVVSTP
jgi:PKD repeat protein